MIATFDELRRHADRLDDAFRDGIFYRSDITPELADDLMSASYEICEGTPPHSHEDAGKHWQGDEYDELQMFWEVAGAYTHNVPVNMAADETSHIGDRSNDISEWLHDRMPNRYLTTTFLSDTRSVHFRNADDAATFAIECLGLRPWDRYRFCPPQPSDLFAIPDFFNPIGMGHRFHSRIFPILEDGYLRSRQHEPLTYPAARPNGHGQKPVRQGTRLWHNNLARQTLDKLCLVKTKGYSRDGLLQIALDMFGDSKRFFVPSGDECGFDRDRLPVLFQNCDDAVLFRLTI